MRNRRIAVAAAVVLAAAAAAGAVPAAADQASSLSCRDRPVGGALELTCDLAGKARGKVVFIHGREPEELYVQDSVSDGLAVTGHLWWSQSGRIRHAELRVAGGNDRKQVLIPENTEVVVQMCLDGDRCGPRYKSFA